MKISVITPTYNSAKTISKTIDSILIQSYKNIEYIVVDGGSTDGTQDIVFKYGNKIDLKFISENDRGIYDAMNKGVKLATGDIVSILNSDDFYAAEDILSLVVENFNNNLDAIYGDISYFFDNYDRVTRLWKPGIYKENKLNHGWSIPHPSLFLRKSIYDNYGLFNLDFKIAADYEFILRVLKIYKIKTKYIPRVFVRMYSRGSSGSNLKQRIKGWKELKKAWKINNLKFPKFLILRRIFSKIFQFIF